VVRVERALRAQGKQLVHQQGSRRASKIDPLIAMLNALQLLEANPEAGNGPSVYETRGALVI
jgi:phage terminase large subunit-like protein